MLGRARNCALMGRGRTPRLDAVVRTVAAKRSAAATWHAAPERHRRVAAPQTSPRRSFSTDDGGGGLFAKTDVHQMIRETARAFAEEQVDPQALEHDKLEQFNMELFRQVGELGFLGVTVPEEYGGTGLDATAAVIIHEELSAADPGFCLSYLAHSMLFCNNLAVNGSAEQCAQYLPDACSGEKIGGMCMSEPGAGTDVLGLSTSATLDGDEYVLKGSKMWITNGCISDDEQGDVFLVYARTGEGASDLSLFIVEKGMEGFSMGQRIKDKCGMRASATAELVFDSVRVPRANLVGVEHGAVKCMMRNLEIERLTLAAMSTGLARRSIEVMNRYASERQAFGQSINSFGQIQAHLATSYAEWQAARAYVYATANELELEATGSNRLDSDGVKLVASVMGTTVANRAMQCLGGYGYVGEYQVERLWRDAKLIEIGGGTLEAHQKNITRELAKELRDEGAGWQLV